MVVLLAVMAAMLFLTAEGASSDEDYFYPGNLAANSVESADTDMDGKASIAEMFHFFTVLMYKTSLDELSLLDVNGDGFLDQKEVLIQANNNQWIFDYLKPGGWENLTADEMIKFFTDHGLEFNKEILVRDFNKEFTQENLKDALEFLVYHTIYFLFLDFSRMRAHLRFSSVQRMFVTNREIEVRATKNGSVHDGSCSKEWLVGFLKKEALILVDPSDFGERVTPSEIRNINVTRATLGWPSANSDGKFSVDELKEFGKLYKLSYADYTYFRLHTVCFPVEDGDLDKDGYMSEVELRDWLKESAVALLDDRFLNKIVASVELFLGRLANVLERYSPARMRTRKRIKSGREKLLFTTSVPYFRRLLGYKMRTGVRRENEMWRDYCKGQIN